MSRHDRARLGDIAEAISVIQGYLERGDLNDGLIYDAVRVRLIEIGEAVKAISPDLLEGEPTIPWREIAACVRPGGTADAGPHFQAGDTGSNPVGVPHHDRPDQQACGPPASSPAEEYSCVGLCNEILEAQHTPSR